MADNASRKLPNVLITGTPGTGKTTTAEKVAEALEGERSASPPPAALPSPCAHQVPEEQRSDSIGERQASPAKRWR
jgi:broad-specificity NMP kinase